MSIRAKTKKRLVILVSVCLATLVLGCAGVWARRVWQNNKALAARQIGMDAAARGDKQAAVDNLTLYIHRYPHDADALYQCALARRDIPLPEYANLDAAIELLRRSVQIKPDSLDAQHALLDLYTQRGYATEGLDWANELLARLPQDKVALHAKAMALGRLRRNDEAQRALEQYLMVAPDDFSAQVTYLFMLQTNRQPSEQIIAYAQGLEAKHPGDSRFALVLAEAYSMAANNAMAMKWTDRAAAHPLPDAQFVDLLIRLFDQTGRFDHSLAILESSADNGSDWIRRLLVERLWEARQPAKALEYAVRFSAATTQPAHAPEFLADLAGYQALALYDLDRKQEIPPLIEALGNADGERAQAWALFLKAVILPADISPRAAIDACRQVIAKDANVPVFHLYSGEAYQTVAESELALHEWQEAFRLSPSWSMPLAKIARLMIHTGKLDEALQYANAASARAPKDVDVIITKLSVYAVALRTMSAADVHRDVGILLDHVEAMRKLTPGDYRLSELTITLLARKGQTRQAAQELTRILNDQAHPPTPDQLLEFFQISHEDHLGLDDACLQAYEKTAGMTPVLALTKARILNEQGKTAEGRALLESIRDQQKDAATQTTWRLMYAQYLDQTNDPQALATLTALGDELTDNFAAQMIVLNGRSTAKDRDLLDRTIDRIKTITGDQAVGWRLARARWMLDSHDIQKDTPEAAAMLHEVVQQSPDMLEARLLLADAMTRLGNRSEAIEQLRAAQELAPDSPSIKLELAGQLQAQGDSDGAAGELAKALKSPVLTPVLERQAAQLLIRRGEVDRAVTLFQKADRDAGGSSGAEPDFQLAQLYRSQDQLDKAESICRAALAQAKPSPEFIEFSAVLFAQRGKDAQAQAALALLDKPGVATPDVKELILGQFSQASGQKDLALAHLRKATELAPDSETAWQAYLAYLAQRGDIQPFLDAAAEAAQSLPATSPLTLPHRQAELVARFAPRISPLYQPLLAALVGDAPHQEQCVDALQAVADSQTANEMVDKLLLRLTPIGERDTQFLALQIVIANLELATNRWSDAVSIARRAMNEFPNAALPAEQVVKALMLAGRWNEALEAAQRFRVLIAAQPMAADLYIAEAQVQLGQPGQALRRVKPYLQEAVRDPDALGDVIRVQVQALIHLGQTQAVRQLLEPLLSKSARCRATWMDAAVIAPDVATGSSWLAQVESQIPEAQLNERVSLEVHWRELGQRFHDAAALKRSRDLLKSLAQRPNVPPEVVLRWAFVVDGENDLAQAEEAYRRVLQLQPGEVVAENNLAMVLVRQAARTGGTVPEEAVSLAEMVVKQRPGNAALLDTQATVLAARKEYDKAAAAERQAADLDPSNLDWQIGLAKILVDGGQINDASKVLLRIDSMTAQGAAVPADLKPDLDAVRRALAAQSAAH